MSRCLPFPPPGYEKKARPDDENLLEKEKQKEKKYKDKEKKDRESREGKQRKDKERSEDKHREKKDRKEKHKDKKVKHREKEKKRTSDEKNTVGPPECHDGENPGSTCIQSDETSEVNFLLELGKRIRDDDKATENLMVQKINVTGGQRSAELPGKVVESNTGNLVESNEKLKDKREDNRKVYGQSNKVDARCTENGSVPNFVGGDQRKVEGVAGLVEKYVEKRMEQKENRKHKNSDSRGDRHKDRDRGKKRKTKDKKQENKKEKEEKSKEKKANKEQLKARENSMNAVYCNSNSKPSSLLKESNKNSNIGKRKELEMNGIVHDEIRPNKLQRPLSSSHQVVENGRKLEPCKTSIQSVPEGAGTGNNHKVNNKVSSCRLVAENGCKLEAPPPNIQFASQWQGKGNNHKVNNNVPSSHPVLENGRTLENCTAGILFASERRGTSNDYKVDNKVSFSHQVLENGTKLEACQAATHLAAGRHGEIGNQTVDEKEHKINGLIEDKKPNVCLTRPSSAPVQVKKIVGESLKPPHPDSKYLSQILSIPNIEGSDLDDQEWLLGSTDFRANKPRCGSSQIEGTKQVWAEALRVESADITALPYVIPY